MREFLQLRSTLFNTTPAPQKFLISIINLPATVGSGFHDSSSDNSGRGAVPAQAYQQQQQ